MSSFQSPSLQAPQSFPINFWRVSNYLHSNQIESFRSLSLHVFQHKVPHCLLKPCEETRQEQKIGGCKVINVPYNIVPSPEGFIDICGMDFIRCNNFLILLFFWTVESNVAWQRRCCFSAWSCKLLKREFYCGAGPVSNSLIVARWITYYAFTMQRCNRLRGNT